MILTHLLRLMSDQVIIKIGAVRLSYSTGVNGIKNVTYVFEGAAL
jgi:hypothetical protein